MSRTKKLLTFSTAALAPWLLMSAVADAQDSDNFAGKTAISMGGKTLTSFDISFVDPAIGLYVLADRTNNAIDMVDTHQNLFLGFCGLNQFQGAKGSNDISGPDGVLIRDHREIWAGDGDSTVKVFDVAGCDGTTTPKDVIKTGVPTDKRADEMCYDPRDQLIMVANNAATPFPFVSLISTASFPYSAKTPTRITFDGTNGTPKSAGIEQCVWSPRTGNFYITAPDAQQVAVISPHTKTVVNKFDIPKANCDAPQGMAVGPDHDLLVGCNGNGSTTHSSVIIDERNGHILATVANESGPDEVWFNPGNNHYFLARSAAFGGVQKLGIIDAETRVADTDISIAPAGKNAHSVAADSVTNKTFLPVPGGSGGTVCSAAGGSDTTGCLLVVTGKNDGDDKRDHGNDCAAQGAPVIGVNDGESQFMRGRCD